MPECFQLLCKTTGEPVSLNAVDELICKEVLNVPVHPKKYGGGYVKGAFNWFDAIGFMIAAGKKPLGSQELRDHYLNSDMWADEAPIIEKILDFMESRFTSRSFYSVR
jgi:hypothetical protein